jgi:hypothetical protein
MARKVAVSNEARFRILFELSNHDKGLDPTKLSLNLGWKGSFSRQKGRGLVDLAYLYEISPKGVTFLKSLKGDR